MEEAIRKAVQVLRDGGIILYPTDTIWGLGCDATNELSVSKLYEVKRRIESKSMLVLIDSDVKLQSYVDVVPSMAWDLIDVSDEPLTIIYPNAKNLAKNLVAEDGSIAIRITNEQFSKKLCERFRKPIVSTSANRSGYPAPVLFSDIDESIKKEVDYVVEFRQNDNRKLKPSSIIKLGINNEVSVIRK